MLKLERLSCGYGPVHAVHEISFDLPAGSVLALLGPNGAGKTSAIMAIMGHVTVHGGRILFEGEDIARRRVVDRVSLGIALVPEGRQLFSDLTVSENLTAGSYACPPANDREKRDRIYTLFPILAERRSQVSGSLSGGEQQMLAIGRALMAEPRLLLVDELSLGLMPKMVDLCIDALTRLKQSGMTILLVEQNTKAALEIADHVCVLSAGTVVFQGKAAEAKSDQSLFDSFLGASQASAPRRD